MPHNGSLAGPTYTVLGKTYARTMRAWSMVGTFASWYLHFKFHVRPPPTKRGLQTYGMRLPCVKTPPFRRWRDPTATKSVIVHRSFKVLASVLFRPGHRSVRRRLAKSIC